MREWQHSTWGIKTDAVTREYCCQSCGASPRIREKRDFVVLINLTVVFLPAIFPALVTGGLLLYRRHVNNSHPVVHGIDPPPIRFPAGSPIHLSVIVLLLFRVTASDEITLHRGPGLNHPNRYEVGRAGLAGRIISVEERVKRGGTSRSRSLMTNKPKRAKQCEPLKTAPAATLIHQN